MRPSPVISALGTGALAFGLAVAVTPGASADTAPAEPDNTADTQQEAMERDLGLTPFEAEDLLTAQEAAVDIDAEAAEAAGEAYGGSLFDVDTLELTVMVTDADAADAVEATGAETSVVTYGTDGLAEIVDELNEVGAEEGVVSWYPDIESDSVVIQAAESTDAETMVEAAGVDAAAVEIEETDEQPQLYSEVIGGEAYYMGGGRCSIGFAATDSSGNGGFVTAGHCGTVGTPAESEDGTGTGEFVESVFPGDDSAFVQVDDNWELTNLVSTDSGTQEVGGSEQAPEGAAVCRSGSTTGWQCGEIEARGETVSYPEGTVTDMTRTSACAEPGDSGGSFIVDDQAQGVTSGGSGSCAAGGTTYYQEVQPMLDGWDLELVTS